MPQTEASSEVKTVRLEIEVPASIADVIRARVASGEFASESEFVTDLLLEAERVCSVRPALQKNEDEWEDEIRETIARLDQGEEPTCTVEEIRQYLEQRRAHRAAA
jgi:Arc/MetJ-type ribon-helix-helix transcriptional regulator